MTLEGKTRLDYPGTLDGVVHVGKQYQVGASVQTNNHETDRFNLVDVVTGDRGWLAGAIFRRFTKTVDPVPGEYWTHLNEGVRVTGELLNGDWEE